MLEPGFDWNSSNMPYNIDIAICINIISPQTPKKVRGNISFDLSFRLFVRSSVRAYPVSTISKEPLEYGSWKLASGLELKYKWYDKSYNYLIQLCPLFKPPIALSSVHHAFETTHIFGTMYARILGFHILSISYEKKKKKKKKKKKIADPYFFLFSQILYCGVRPLF